MRYARKEEGASHPARRGKNAEAFLNDLKRPVQFINAHNQKQIIKGRNKKQTGIRKTQMVPPVYAAMLHAGRDHTVFQECLGHFPDQYRGILIRMNIRNRKQADCRTRRENQYEINRQFSNRQDRRH